MPLVIAFLVALMQAPSLVGTWRGTSTCVDKKNHPACNDEQIIYDAVAHPGFRDSVTLKADKIVNGQRESMGEMEFAKQKDGTWRADIQAPRYHLRVDFHVDGTHLTGEMIDLATNQRARVMKAERVP
jgi:hypothetical protein